MDDPASASAPPTLRGSVFPSEVQPGVEYRLLRHVGEGAMGVVYLATRHAPEGESVVVVKLVNPGLVEADLTADIFAHKEAVALGRLNERVPPCPFVVRFVDTGAALIDNVMTPWIAVEYVHGGIEGTTLEDRVAYSVHRTGYAFDPVRAAHALRCLAAGLSAIHSVDVIHRDLTPGNVLCCGFGETEIFKISDFGIARSEGLTRTFAGWGVGTTGYATPEQVVPSSETPIRPYTDVFALACVFYFLLTGHHYIDAPNPVVAYEIVMGRKRPKLTDSPFLSPELAERPEACEAIDEILARATSPVASERPPTADLLAEELLPWLTDTPSAPHSSRRLVTAILGIRRATRPENWSFIVKQQPRDHFVVRSAAWDTDGHCFAITAGGPRFWDGQRWLDASSLDLPASLAFTQRYEAGGWLIGGGQGLLAVCNTRGVVDVVRWHEPELCFTAGSGRFDTLFVAVGVAPNRPPTLHCMTARRWLEPLVLHGVQHVSTLVRLDDLRWLVAGRLTNGTGFVALYSPIENNARLVATPQVRAFVSGASAYERELALIVGSHGVALRMEADRATPVRLDGEPDLTAAGLDMLGREWVTSVGTLWTRDPAESHEWNRVWHDPNFETPFVSLMADAGYIVALTADGGVVEGRESSHSRPY